MSGEGFLWGVFEMVWLIAFFRKRMLAFSDHFGPWTWGRTCCRFGDDENETGSVVYLTHSKSFYI